MTTQMFHSSNPADVLSSKLNALFVLPAVNSFGRDSTLCQGQEPSLFSPPVQSHCVAASMISLYTTGCYTQSP